MRFRLFRTAGWPEKRSRGLPTVHRYGIVNKVIFESVCRSAVRTVLLAHDTARPDVWTGDQTRFRVRSSPGR